VHQHRLVRVLEVEEGIFLCFMFLCWAKLNHRMDLSPPPTPGLPDYPNGNTIPNDHKIYQMAINYLQWP
jgi:hypothetical protein